MSLPVPSLVLHRPTRDLRASALNTSSQDVREEDWQQIAEIRENQYQSGIGSSYLFRKDDNTGSTQELSDHQK